MNAPRASAPAPTSLLRAAAIKFARSDGNSGASRFALVFWVLASIVLAVVSRTSIGARSVLSFGALMLPMLSFTVVGRVVGAQGLTRRVTEWSRLGAPRTSVASAHLVVALGVSAFATALLGALFVAIAHKEGDPALLSDLSATFVASLVCGAAYAAYFALGSTFRDGLGRSLFLGLDFVLGGTGGLSLLLPRAHVRSLLGGANVGSLRPGASLLVVVILAASFAALAVFRVRRVR